MSVGKDTIEPMKELERQIEIARNATQYATRIEIENDYADAMLSMERTYCEGYQEALEFAYIILNGHGYNEA